MIHHCISKFYTEFHALAVAINTLFTSMHTRIVIKINQEILHLKKSWINQESKTTLNRLENGHE